MILVTVSVAATGYAFFLDVRRGAENDRFLAWLRAERKPEWDRLTRADRFLTMRAVEILRRGTLSDDDEFQRRYRQTRPGSSLAFAVSIASAAMALVIIGTVLLDWSW